jgi:hypothetical protein
LPSGFFTSYLERGNCTILLDGLDEIVNTTSRQFVARSIVSLAKRYSTIRIIVTSRIAGYRLVPLGEDFVSLILTDFDKNEIADFVRKWSSLTTTEDQVHAKQEAEALITAISSRPELSRLASNPLLLTVISTLFRNRVRLPESRVELYDEALNVLLEQWDAARGIEPIGLSLSDKRNLLAKLALLIHENSPSGIVEESLVVSAFNSEIQNRGISQKDALEQASLLLVTLTERSGVLIQRGAGLYGFVHLTFEEYLAAVELAQHDDLIEYIHARYKDSRWREVIIWAVAYVGRAIRARAAEVIRFLIQTNDPEGIVLAGKCLLETTNLAMDNRELRLQTIEALSQVITNLPAYASVRVQAGVVLGQLGWLSPNHDELVLIPASADQSAFLIGRHLITNATYRQFIEDLGYEQREFWSQDGWMWRQNYRINQPAFWSDPSFNLPNMPVAGISAYEAEAFCAWLSRKRGSSVRLPTEAEWNKAAQGPEMRKWPWGDEFDPNKANVNDTSIGVISAVGCFPAGVSPFGVFDMSGNVWEWCYAEEQGKRILKGGSWASTAEESQIASRLFATPEQRNQTIGFRVVELSK